MIATFPWRMFEMEKLLAAMAEGQATVPQIAAYLNRLAERLKTNERKARVEAELDERSIGELLKAINQLEEATDSIHSAYFPAKMTMHL